MFLQERFTHRNLLQELSNGAASVARSKPFHQA
jgi:hypothetical protein